MRGILTVTLREGVNKEMLSSHSIEARDVFHYENDDGINLLLGWSFSLMMNRDRYLCGVAPIKPDRLSMS